MKTRFGDKLVENCQQANRHQPSSLILTTQLLIGRGKKSVYFVREYAPLRLRLVPPNSIRGEPQSSKDIIKLLQLVGHYFCLPRSIPLCSWSRLARCRLRPERRPFRRSEDRLWSCTGCRRGCRTPMVSLLWSHLESLHRLRRWRESRRWTSRSMLSCLLICWRNANKGCNR